MTKQETYLMKAFRLIEKLTGMFLGSFPEIKITYNFVGKLKK